MTYYPQIVAFVPFSRESILTMAFLQDIEVDELDEGNISAATLGLKYHTQHFNLRCFKSDFDVVKRKFGLFIE